MSKLSTNTRYNPQIKIGEFVSVMGGTSTNGTSIAGTTYGEFVACDGVYNQSDYPDLYAQIGLIGAFNWATSTQSIASSTNNAYDMIYGNGKYILPLYNSTLIQSTIYTSTNATNWTNSATITYNSSNLIYGNGLYVMGAAVTGTTSSPIYTSTNATNWTFVNIPNNGQPVQGLGYGNGIYIAAGSSWLSTSTNASNWTSSGFVAPTIYSKIIYNNGLYVYGGSSGAVGTSTNAINWTTGTSGTPQVIYEMCYGNGLYVYVGEAGTLASSTNAINWTARTSGASVTINNIVYANGLYVYTGAGVFGSSTDAINWTSRYAPTTSTVSAFTYGNGLYVGASIIGNIILTSTNPTVLQYASNYNVSTQFYVPAYTSNKLTLSTSTNYSSCNIQSFVRGK